MINKRLRKPDRYHPSIFFLFCTSKIRSISLENLNDHNRRKQGKRKKKRATNISFIIEINVCSSMDIKKKEKK
jgi:hypothetical protein